jgi:cytochrome c oxidase subunit II
MAGSMSKLLATLLPALLAAGCGSSQQFPAIPPGLDLLRLPTDSVEVTAQRYVFTPDEIRVHVGTRVVLRVTAMDAEHGFALPAFGIDERLEQGVAKTIVFYPPEKGTYDFKCSHYCGAGHFGMNGRIIVD